MDTDTTPLNVLELRQYTLHPGRRDELIDLFDRAFVETQEAVGMAVVGQFRDLDHADRFAWLRGFADMGTRLRGLQAFYGGPVWAAHRHAANATMIDSDDVLLLRPAWPGAGLRWRPAARAAHGATARPGGALRATIGRLHQPAAGALLAHCRNRPAGPALQQGWYVTEPTPNDFPRLPVHEDRTVVVHIALFADEAAASRAPQAADGLQPWLSEPAQVRRWEPTARSALHA